MKLTNGWLAALITIGLGTAVSGQTGYITTVAGGGPIEQTPLGLNGIYRFAQAPNGDFYFTSNAYSAIYKWSGNTVTLIAGTPGISGVPSQNVPAIQSLMRDPQSIVVASNGNVLFADTANRVIRQISPDGVVTTVAGNGSSEDKGDGGPALQASFVTPQSLAFDATGNLYISDTFSNKVRRVSTSGIITTVAGNGVNGFFGDGGPATSASLSRPRGIAFDGAGNLYIADTDNQRVRKVAPDGTITSVAGNGLTGFAGDGGLATGARIFEPYHVAIDSLGNLFIAEYNNRRIRKVTSAGIISTVGGNGSSTYSGDGGNAVSAGIPSPEQVTVDAQGNLFVMSQHRVRKISPSGQITTIAGNGFIGYSGDGGPASNASLRFLRDIVFDSTGSYYVSDSGNDRIRKIAPDGTISLVAGSGQNDFVADGYPAQLTNINSPYGIAIGPNQNLYLIHGGYGMVKKLLSDGRIQTVAGTGLPGSTGDGGLAVNATLYGPESIALDSSGNLYIADTQNNKIRRVGTNGIITTFAGTGIPGYSGDGGPATSANLNRPRAIIFDVNGNLLFCDRSNRRVRKIDTNGVITTIAGTGATANTGDGGLAIDASFMETTAIQFDPAGNLYIADGSAGRIRKITADGFIQTIAGSSSFGFREGVLATTSQVRPNAIAFDPQGNLLIADQLQRVRKIALLNATSTTVSSNVGSGVAQNILLTATVSPALATGSVHFFAGSTLLGTSAISAGTASLSTQGLQPGSYQITATYNGNQAYSNSTSQPILITVITDSTPPILTPIASGIVGSNGWYKGPVTVTWTAIDAESGVSATPCMATTIPSDTAGQVVTCSATNGAGLTQSQSVTIKIDSTNPILSSVSSPVPNNAGWNNTNVTVSFNCVDQTSGVAAQPVAEFLIAEGPSLSVSRTCFDNAGNSVEINVSNIRIDKSSPTISLSSRTPANPAGWNNGPVAVVWSCGDSLSGVAQASTSDIKNQQGTNQTASGVCTDLAGNSANSTLIGINIDLTSPVITFLNRTAPNAAGWNNVDVTSNWICSDSLSGVVSPSYSRVVTSEGANQTATGFCVDLAGNSNSALIGGINIDKTSPVVLAGSVAASSGGSSGVVPINSDIGLSASLADSGGSGLVVAYYQVDNLNLTALTFPLSGNSLSLNNQSPPPPLPAFQFALPEVYKVCVIAEDLAGNRSSGECIPVPAYDSEAGFVTGGGWFQSKVGSYRGLTSQEAVTAPLLTGRATFGFLSKYQKGASSPTGTTDFQFSTANFTFESTHYDWLVVAGTKAQFKGVGSGTVGTSQVGNLGFLITAVDGRTNGGDGADKFRIKIWRKDSGAIVYDNYNWDGSSVGSPPDGESVEDGGPQPIGGGSIKIHAK